MRAQGLSLDVLLAPGFSTLLPNLQVLSLKHCVLTPAARTTLLDTGCCRLRQLSIQGLAVAPPPALAGAAPAQPTPALQLLATAQLKQLAKLPSLSSITLADSSCPTLFLVALGTQLTCLQLDHSYRQSEPDTQSPTPAWRATLQHVARCTRLRELTIPCAAAEELGLVAPALQPLRTLRLNASRAQTDGNAMMVALLSLPHLTRLHWGTLAFHTFKRWHNDSTCWWEELSLSVVAPQQLARLPLHSLKRPVEWSCLAVRGDTPLREVRAAVANVTRRCPAGFRWAAHVHETEPLGPPRLTQPPRLRLLDAGGMEVDVPAVLRALQPLLAPLTEFELRVAAGVEWRVEWVGALGEVLPRTCTRLALGLGSVSGDALDQVARNLPWVERLELVEQQVVRGNVVAFVRTARRLKQEGGEGAAAARLEVVAVVKPVRAAGEGEEEHKRAWERAVQRLREEAGGGDMALRVVW